MDAAKALIITAELDPSSFAWLDGLRREHFPQDRNFLSAHLTMFHQVSPDDAESVAQLRLPPTPLTVQFTGVRFLGRGVAINVACAPLSELRETLRQQLRRVTAQDSQSWRPHVTIQNKVSSSAARQLYNELGSDFHARNGRITGVLLWDYLGGPWSLLQRFPFA